MHFNPILNFWWLIVFIFVTWNCWLFSLIRIFFDLHLHNRQPSLCFLISSVWYLFRITRVSCIKQRRAYKDCFCPFHIFCYMPINNLYLNPFYNFTWNFQSMLGNWFQVMKTRPMKSILTSIIILFWRMQNNFFSNNFFIIVKVKYWMTEVLFDKFSN